MRSDFQNRVLNLKLYDVVCAVVENDSCIKRYLFADKTDFLLKYCVF